MKVRVWESSWEKTSRQQPFSTINNFSDNKKNGRKKILRKINQGPVDIKLKQRLSAMLKGYLYWPQTIRCLTD